jgi:hypothetical protein
MFQPPTGVSTPMTRFAPEYRFRHAADAEINEVPDGAVLYLEARERVHFLNATAYRVFTLCDGTLTLAEVIDRLAADFELDEVPRDDVFDCIDSLLAEDLVRPA